jgi:plasmid stability protein
MKALHYQYTIRNVPEPVNRYLRKRATITGKSLNQVIIDELSEKVAPAKGTIGETLDWFIGSGMDDASLKALEEEDTAQKALVKRELKKIDDLGF